MPRDLDVGMASTAGARPSRYRHNYRYNSESLYPAPRRLRTWLHHELTRMRHKNYVFTPTEVFPRRAHGDVGFGRIAPMVMQVIDVTTSRSPSSHGTARVRRVHTSGRGDTLT